jgi:hypothetical protein
MKKSLIALAYLLIGSGDRWVVGGGGGELAHDDDDDDPTHSHVEDEETGAVAVPTDGSVTSSKLQIHVSKRRKICYPHPSSPSSPPKLYRDLYFYSMAEKKK